MRLLRLLAIAFMVASGLQLFGGSVSAEPFVDQFTIPNAEVLSFSPDGQWLAALSPLPVSAGFAPGMRALQSDDNRDDDDPKLCIYAFPTLVTRSCTPAGGFDADTGPR